MNQMRLVKQMKISILICTWNRLNYLKECLKSALGQVYQDTEIIVLDNGSTDGTYEYLKTMPGISVCRNEVNDRTAGRWKTLIDAASGDVVYLLMDDDILHDEEVLCEVAVKFLQNPMLEVFYGSAFLINSKGEQRGEIKAEPMNVFKLWNYEYINFGTMFYRREVFKKLNLFDTNLIYYHDWEIKLRCALECQCLGEDIFVVKYRAHGGQDSCKMTNEIRLKENLLMRENLRKRYAGFLS